MRMAVPQCIHGDAGCKIEIAFAIRGDEPYAFAPLEGEVDTRKSRHQMRCHGPTHVLAHGLARKAARSKAARLKRQKQRGSNDKSSAAQTKCAASPGGTEQHCISTRPAV